MGAYIGIADTQLLEAQLGSDRPDAVGEGGIIGEGIGHQVGRLLGHAYNCARAQED